MTNPTIKIHNVETGEVIEREMTVEELTQMEADVAKAQEIRVAEAAALAEAEAAKVAAQAKLAALGLTADDLKALGLGNN
jgi:hypothetical protein